MGIEKKDDPRAWDMEWAGSFGAGHGDHKTRIPLNVSTSAVSLPNFIVIKDQRQYQLHTPLWPCLCPGSCTFLTLLFQLLSGVLGRRKLGLVQMCPLKLGPGRAVNDQEEGLPA